MPFAGIERFRVAGMDQLAVPRRRHTAGEGRPVGILACRGACCICALQGFQGFAHRAQRWRHRDPHNCAEQHRAVRLPLPNSTTAMPPLKKLNRGGSCRGLRAHESAFAYFGYIWESYGLQSKLIHNSCAVFVVHNAQRRC